MQRAEILAETEEGTFVKLFVPHGSSMLESEELIQSALNSAGNVVTSSVMKRFDADGSPIVVCGRKLTSKGEEVKKYQTPYGIVHVARHVYQGMEGGATYVPMEELARIVLTSTPKFAQMLSDKYSSMPAKAVVNDFESNHGRKVSPNLVQDTSEYVANGISMKEEVWAYSLAEFKVPVASIAIGMDGAMLNLREEGWREGMVGSFTFYDSHGDRLDSLYTAAAPEYGKEKFLGIMARRLEELSKKFPDAIKVGVADGAKVNWNFLDERTDVQVLDFYHATEYVAKAAEVFFVNSKKRQRDWIDGACYRLKNHSKGAEELLAEIRLEAQKIKTKKARKVLASVISYFRNNLKRMSYHSVNELDLPIGSGVTEAAAKTIIKQRLCLSGMRWLRTGVHTVLTLRTMIQSGTNWKQFWTKVDQHGFPKVC